MILNFNSGHLVKKISRVIRKTIRRILYKLKIIERQINTMRVQHITHPSMGPDEYYFCVFASQDDIDNFCSTINEPTLADDLSIQVGDTCVIQAHTGKFYEKWYEKLDPGYFKRELQKDLEVKNSVLQAASMFFG